MMIDLRSSDERDQGRHHASEHKASLLRLPANPDDPFAAWALHP